MHHPGVIFNIRQPNVKSSLSKLQCELCKSAQVRSPDELAHVTWSFNGSQMCTTQEPTQRNISTYHISQSKKIIFRDSSYILGENSIPSDLKAHYRWTIEHWKGTLAPELSPVSVLLWIQKDCEIISTAGRRKKEWTWGEGMITAGAVSSQWVDEKFHFEMAAPAKLANYTTPWR